jgi:hypothetical protein
MRSRISGAIPTVERQADRMEESSFDECRFHFTRGHVATTRNQENAPWIAASTVRARGQWDRPMRAMVLVSRSVALCKLVPRRADKVRAASGSGAGQ